MHVGQVELLCRIEKGSSNYLSALVIAPFELSLIKLRALHNSKYLLNLFDDVSYVNLVNTVGVLSTIMGTHTPLVSGAIPPGSIG